MIEHLEIRNYALIENLSIDFSEGFNVITGETGSGKSIILGALGLLMGEKADVSGIRTGTDGIVVNAVVSVPENHEIIPYLANLGIVPEDGAVIIRRTVRSNGRGTITIQGQLVSRQELTIVADSLIDMHGQSEHQSLLLHDKQRKVLDNYASDSAIMSVCQEACKQYFSLSKKIEEVRERVEEGIKQEDYLRFALSEIEAAALYDGEDEELKNRIGVLGKFETVFESVTACNEKLKQSRSLLHDAYTECQKASKCDTSLVEYCDRLESSSIETEDIVESLRAYVSSVDYSEETINSLQERLGLIQKLKRKYGPSISDVIAFGKNAKESLEIADNSQQVLANLEEDLKQAETHYLKVASELSETRKKHAKDLQKSIETTLRTLGMPDALFEIVVETDNTRLSQTGMDTVSFQISANPGEPLKPIQNIASGGELSRVMLALKTVLAKEDSTQTQVFDEVDSGIGGTVARALASSISDLSKQKQVIAITHLASIASTAQSQFVVSKSVENGRTFTHLKEVEGQERTIEIARMLSGDTDGVSLEHARALLRN